MDDYKKQLEYYVEGIEAGIGIAEIELALLKEKGEAIKKQTVLYLGIVARNRKNLAIAKKQLGECE